MNKKRRKLLGDANELIKQAVGIVEKVVDEEQEVVDNVPANLQESERYSDMEDALGTLEDLCDDLNDITERIEGLV